jgi:hypothetical protein
VAYASGKAAGELAFRLPLSLQLIPPFFIFFGALLIPESPRWLTMWGKSDRAAKILAKYHGGGDPNHPVVRLEMHEFEQSIELQKSSNLLDYKALLVRPSFIRHHHPTLLYYVCGFVWNSVAIANNIVSSSCTASTHTTRAGASP